MRLQIPKKSYWLMAGIALLALALIIYVKWSAKRSPVADDSPRSFAGVASSQAFTPLRKGDFRLELGQKELFVIGDKTTRLYDLDDPRPRPDIAMPLYHVFFAGDSVIAYNEKDNTLYYQLLGTTVRTTRIADTDDLLLVSGGGVYYGNEPQNLNVEYAISRPGTVFRFNVSRAVAPYLEGVDSLCRSNYTEGIMLDYDDSSFIFLPYRLNIVLLVNKRNAAYRTLTTIIKKLRVDLKQVRVDLPNGAYMVTCAPEQGSDMLQWAITANHSEIYILPAQVHRSGDNFYDLVDVYDKASFKYKHTLRMQNAGEGDYLLDIEANDEALYLLSNKRGVIKAGLR